MHIILLERVSRLGNIGSVVEVKDGFARNFLIPQGKALRATAANKEYFEKIRSSIEAENLARRGSAEEKARHIEGQSIIVVRQASEKGHLYGSVSAKDIAHSFNSKLSFVLDKSQILISAPIKEVGLHYVSLALHPEIACQVSVVVAQSQEEGEKMLKDSKNNTHEENSENIGNA